MDMIKNTLFTNKQVKTGENSGFDNYIMAIESSCDETACAIVKNGREVIANVVASQIKTHAKFGGVIPEVAAREHLLAINPVIEETFAQANLKPENITAFAGTVGPGLVGCLLVGLNAAKTLAMIYDKPFIGINHLNGHISANFLNSDVKPPFITLLISGGHTQIIEVKADFTTKILGETIDDAIGEAYDKVARLMGIPYPGGVNVDKFANIGNKNAFQLPIAKVDGLNFSFSGLKTAVLRLVKSFDSENIPINDICASFQECVSKTLAKKVQKALDLTNYDTVVLAGGVAANSEIRRKIFALECNTFAPELKYCTDNAAMIASCAYFFNDTYDNIDVEVFSRLRK